MAWTSQSYNMELLNKLSNHELVVGFRQVKFEKDKVYDACQMGKQTKKALINPKSYFILQTLELLHVDLFGPIRTYSLRGKRYTLTIVDSFSRFTWVSSFATKNETLEMFSKLCNKFKMRKKGS